MPDQVHQIGRVLAVVDGEGGIKSDPIGIFAQKPGADTMKRACPGQRIGHGPGAVADDLPRAGDDEERRTRCGVVLTRTMLDSSSLFAVEAFKISNGHWWQIDQRRSRYSTTIPVLFANGSVTQAWPLKVSAIPGATDNRIGSNRYRHSD